MLDRIVVPAGVLRAKGMIWMNYPPLGPPRTSMIQNSLALGCGLGHSIRILLEKTAIGLKSSILIFDTYPFRQEIPKRNGSQVTKVEEIKACIQAATDYRRVLNIFRNFNNQLRNATLADPQVVLVLGEMT